MNERTRELFERTAQVTRTAARTTGKVALWTAAAVASLWILGKAGELEAEKETKKPPVLTKFDGYDDTYTAPFTTGGPWQISWEGNLDIIVWQHQQDSTPTIYDSVGANGGSAFFPLAGTFYLVVRCLESGLWSITVRSY
jgi:hypothetical protein